MSTATFIGYDLVSSGAWLETATRRGTAGYHLSDTDAATFVSSLPSYVSGVQTTGFQYDGTGPTAPRLERPGGGTALAGRLYAAATNSFFVYVDAGDSAQHYLSIYAVDDVGLGRLQTYTLYDGSHVPLASHAINYDFSGGVWVTFLISGTVEVEVSPQGATPNTVTCGFTWDETEPPMATASGGATTVAATGTLAVSPLTLTSSSASVAATGTLTIDAVAMAGSSAVDVGATGSLAVSSIAAGGSSAVKVGATGGVAVSPLTLIGSSSPMITTSGTLTVAPLTLSGSSTVSIPTTGGVGVSPLTLSGSSTTTVGATGVMTVGPLTISGSESVVVVGSGSLAVSPLVVVGSSGVVVPATGTLNVGSVSATGAGSTYTPAVGVLVVGPATMLGSTGSRIDAVGTLAIDPVGTRGRGIYYVTSNPFAAYSTPCGS